MVLERLAEDRPEWAQVDPRDLANKTLDRLFFWSPFTGFALFTLFGMVWMAYAEKLSLAVRVRYIYALLIPATMFMLLATLAMVIAPESLTGYVSFLSLFGGAIIASITAYFGAFPETESKGGRLMRAIVLGFALITVMMISTFIALMLGMYSAMSEAAAMLKATAETVAATN